MPIGAVIGGAVIAGGATIASGAMSSSAQKKAAATAATTAQNTTDSNNQLFRENKAQNIAIAQPFYNNGVAAGNALQGLLLGAPAAAPAPAPASSALGGYQTNPVAGAPVPYNAGPYAGGGGLAAQAVAMQQNDYAGDYGIPNYGGAGALGGGAYQPPVATGGNGAGVVPAQGGAPATGSATGTLNPWDQFRNSTNYQWRYDQGLKATEGNFATKGALDSGAAEKAKITFGQNFASNELSNYMNLLAGQQNVGLSAGNAIMGVSTSAANAIAGQNTNAGNVAANAALTSGQATANMWGTVGNTAGQLGGALFQYGMGQFKPQTTLPAAGGGYNVNSGTANYFASNPFGGFG